MKIDRALQLEMLNHLANKYPDDVYNIVEPSDEQTLLEKKIANLLYLEEHGLIRSGLVKGNGNHFQLTATVITAAGLDFLANDGGLSAILGVVTIKLHDDTIRQLIEARIQSAELPETTKSHLLKSLREAPGETVTLLTEKLLDASLSSWPAAIAVIQKFL